MVSRLRNLSAESLLPTPRPRKTMTVYIREFLIGIGEPVNHPAFLGQIAEHEHADQRGGGRQEDRTDPEGQQRQDDLFQLGDMPQLDHLDLALLFCGQPFHDRRLDEGDQGHVGIGGNGDGTEEPGLTGGWPGRWRSARRHRR